MISLILNIGFNFSSIILLFIFNEYVRIKEKTLSLYLNIRGTYLVWDINISEVILSLQHILFLILTQNKNPVFNNCYYWHLTVFNLYLNNFEEFWNTM